jgi:hypothetical protein
MTLDLEAPETSFDLGPGACERLPARIAAWAS